MSYLRLLLLCLAFSFMPLAEGLLAQEYDLAKFNLTRLRTERKALSAKALWGGGNAIYHATQTSGTSRSDRYFHQANVIVGIGSFTSSLMLLPRAIRQDPSEITIAQTLREQRKTEKILMLSTGLDVAYITLGLYLDERSHSNGAKHPDQLEGWGKALIYNGTFFLVTDLVQLIIHGSNNKRLKKLIENLQFGPGYIGIRKKLN